MPGPDFTLSQVPEEPWPSSRLRSSTPFIGVSAVACHDAFVWFHVTVFYNKLHVYMLIRSVFEKKNGANANEQGQLGWLRWRS